MSLIDVLIGHVLIVTGHERRQTIVLWIRAALLASCAAVGMHWGLEGIATGAAASSVLMFVVAILVLKATLGCRITELLSIFWRPTLAAVAMAWIVHYSVLALAGPSILRLAVSVAVGVLSYATVLLLLWLVAGRPAGAESAMVDIILRRRKAVPG